MDRSSLAAPLLLTLLGGLADDASPGSKGWRYGRLDSLASNLVLALLGDDTEYSVTYSEERFAAIARGMSAGHVLKELGNPVYRAWLYPVLHGRRRCCTVVFDASGAQVVSAEFPDVRIGASSDEVVNRYGRAAVEHWVYAGLGVASAEDRNYRHRSVVLRDGIVTETHHYVMID